MKNFIIIALGTYGDVNPLVGLGKRLNEKGNEIYFVTNPYFKEFVEGASLNFIPIGTKEGYIEGINNPDLWNPRKSSRVVLNTVIKPNIELIYELLNDYKNKIKFTVIAPNIAFGARLAQEKWGIELVTVYYSQCSIQSDREVMGFSFPSWIPTSVSRSILSLMDRMIIEPVMGAPVNKKRKEIGLKPIKSGNLMKWMNSPDMVLALFPEWLKPFQPGWPKQTIQTGFTYYDGEDKDCKRVIEFAQKESPLVFTTGTGVVNEKQFFETALQVTKNLNKKAIFCSKDRKQIPTNLPEYILYTDYVPFKKLLPYSSLIVHHGGMGTMVQAIEAGIPQVIRPLAHDQFQNGEVVERLGIGRVIKNKKFNVKNSTDVIEQLLTSVQVKDKCKKYSKMIDNEKYLEDTCNLLMKEKKG